MTSVIWHRRRRLWLTLFAFGFSALALYALFVMPQSYTAKISLSLQRPGGAPSGSMGALAVLGMGTTGKTYIGVLHSRSFAEIAESKVHLKDLYGLPDTDEAVELLQKGVHAEDNALDSLTYITVTLPAPARFAPDPKGERQKVRQLVAQIANDYTIELRRYLKDNDTETDAALQRQADIEMNKARKNYEAARGHLAEFLRNRENGNALARSSNAQTGSVAQSMTAMDEVATLYLKRADLEQKLRSMEAEQSETANILKKPDQLERLPEEDPLLNEARAEVSQARAKLDNLQISLAPTNPEVVDAKLQLQRAQERLKTKVESLLKEQGSETIKRKALQAMYDEVVRQIQDAERNFQRGMERNADWETLKSEVQLALKALETALSRVTEMRITKVTANNRMSVVDAAQPPKRSAPGLAIMLAMSFFLPLIVIGAWFVIEYIVAASQVPRISPVTERGVPGNNGH